MGFQHVFRDVQGTPWYIYNILYIYIYIYQFLDKPKGRLHRKEGYLPNKLLTFLCVLPYPIYSCQASLSLCAWETTAMLVELHLAVNKHNKEGQLPPMILTLQWSRLQMKKQSTSQEFKIVQATCKALNLVINQNEPTVLHRHFLFNPQSDAAQRRSL